MVLCYFCILHVGFPLLVCSYRIHLVLRAIIVIKAVRVSSLDVPVFSALV